MAANSFVMRDSWMDILYRMPNEEAGEMIKAIAAHRRGEEIGDLDNPVLGAVVEMICDEIDRMCEEYEDQIAKKREAGRKGGISKSKQSQAVLSSAKQSQAVPADAKHNVYDSVYESDSEYVSDYESESDTPNGVDLCAKAHCPENGTPTEEIIEYLNQRAGTHYRPNTGKTKTLIGARMREGFTVDDFYTVIDKKCSEWLGTVQEKYLRPETLFGTKFEGYLNQRIVRARDPSEEQRRFFADVIGG